MVMSIKDSVYIQTLSGIKGGRRVTCHFWEHLTIIK